MKATLGRKGQLTLPKAVREALGLKPGDQLLLRLEGDRIVLRPRRRLRVEEFLRLLPAVKPPVPFPGFAAEKEAAMEYVAEREAQRMGLKEDKGAS